MAIDELTKDTQPLLGSINSPEDLKTLSNEALRQLAAEVRDLIVRTVSQRGGHLASSLGVVELTLAILKVFSPPQDRIVFDVGHQAYAYKILTGRRDAFVTLRSRKGVSGFPKRAESEYDLFDVGHAGNAISVAAGMAQARCFDGQNHKVIAVVGDGSLTCGVSYEGLNQAGAAEKDLIIILNDNEMSISPNVGAIAAYLNRIMTGQLVTRFREEVKNVLKNFPGIMGRSMYTMARQFEDALKGFVTPGRLFEDLGFNYVGPIDGHQIKHLVDTLQNVKRFKEPVLVHTITCKGKGYCQAEQDPSRFHGVGPFDITTGKTEVRDLPPTYTSVFGRTMVRMGTRDQKIVAVTAAMEYGTGLAEFARLFPKRFFDVGIAEQHGVVFAAGLAREGYKPVVAIYSTFMQRGYDHLVHDVCMQEYPVVFAMDRAGIVGEDGPTHHGVFDIAFCRHIPNLVMMAPSDENELLDMMATALSMGRPCVIRYPRAHGLGVTLRKDPQALPLKARALVTGNDLVIIAIGSMVAPAIEASRILHQEGLSVGVIDARFIKPLDKELILPTVSRIRSVLTVEEGILAGGFGSSLLELFADSGLENVKVVRMGVPDRFIEHGTREELLEEIGLTPTHIAEQCRIMIKSPATPKHLRINVGS
ncbi:MAG: 1-deoxy-D-xylulose-5-phosphate synthase [Thermodesulfobacteriota bacterium]|nr:1-deoxy-D-xylulose-5-phosphate synthase [Thermodesulfobacteriota bacterium]